MRWFVTVLVDADSLAEAARLLERTGEVTEVAAAAEDSDEDEADAWKGRS